MNKRATTIISPENSGLLFCDFDLSADIELPTERDRIAAAAIVHAARLFLVPGIASLYARVGRPQHPENMLLPEDHQLRVRHRTALDPWEDEGFRAELKRWTCGHLILCGRGAAGSVTFAALGALAAGFNVHVVVDATVWPDKRLEAVHLARLEQAGVVPIGAKQLILEWFDHDGRATPVDDALAFLKAHKL